MDGFALLRQTLRVQVQIPVTRISIGDEYDHVYGLTLLKMKKANPVVGGVMTHGRGRPEHEQTHGQTNE